MTKQIMYYKISWAREEIKKKEEKVTPENNLSIDWDVDDYNLYAILLLFIFY